MPPDEQVALTAEALPGIVLSTRAQAHARMAQPDQLGAWSLAVPTSMVLGRRPRGLGPGGPVTWEYYRRVEPMPPYGDVQRGFSAEVADPLWMLGRQWQVGEHAAEDAASPVLVELEVAHTPLDPVAGIDPTIVPAEALLEGAAEDWWTVGPEGPRRPGGERRPVGRAAGGQRVLELARSRTATRLRERSTGSRSGGPG